MPGSIARDTFAVDLLEHGTPLEEVSKALGHESIKTTEKHYPKWVRSRQDRLDALVMATWEQKPKAAWLRCAPGLCPGAYALRLFFWESVTQF